MSNPERPVFNDRYEVSSRIGRGGMADVFLARDRLLDRPVAVKVLFPEFATDPNFVERFRREAQAAANLSHPNIVGVFDWGKQGTTYFIVMEYVNGRSLADIIRADGIIQPQRAAEIASDVAAALGFAHAAGVVHRDIKPGNILVSPSGTVKVADFGIARAVNTPAEHELTQAGAVMGTATYFSPEQAQGSTPDPRSDLYSLGIVMYEMAGGSPPFAGDNPVAIAYKQVHEAPRPLADLVPGVPPSYEAITMRLLSKQPANRYPTSEDLRIDLKRFRDGGPLAADSFPPDPPARSAAPPTTSNSPVASVTAATAAIDSLSLTPPHGTTVISATPRTQVQPRQSAPVRPVQPQQPARQTAAPATYVPQQPNRTGWYIAAALFTVALLAIAGFALVKMLGNQTPGLAATDQVSVPTLISMPLPEAQKQLEDLFLTPKTEAVPNDKFGANVVWDQDPKPGNVVDRGSPVRLIYNPAKTTKALPALEGKSVDEAKAALTQLQLAFEFKDVESEAVPAGTIVSQDPKAGEVGPTTKVVLSVSVGKGKASVPNVATFDLARALNELVSKGFKTATKEQPDDAEKGKVIGTDPAAGTEVEKGSTVTVIQSAGPAPVTVPEVVGLSELEATNKLRAADFLVEVVPVDGTAAQAGKVISQTPAQSEKAPKKSTVTINVGKPFVPTTTTTTTTTTTIAVTASFDVVTRVKLKDAADSTYGASIDDNTAPYEFAWKIDVRNTGNTKLTGITASSANVPGCNAGAFDLEAGATRTISCISTIALVNRTVVNDVVIVVGATSAGSTPGQKSASATARSVP